MAAAPSGAAEPRTTVAVVLSWYTALGASNGRVGWKEGGFAYQSMSRSTPKSWTALLHNAPLLAQSNAGIAQPANGSPRYWELVRASASAELTQLKSAGFDVVAFDMQPRPSFRPNSPISHDNEPFTFFSEFKIWLDEAQKIGLRACIFADVWAMSGDFPQKKLLSSDQWRDALVSALDQAASHPAYWRIGRDPVVMHFATDRRMNAAPDPSATTVDGGWSAIIRAVRQSGQRIHFVSDVRRPDVDGESWMSWSNAMYMFIPAAPTSYLSEYQTAISRKYGPSFFWSVSPGYYRPKLSFVPPDFRRLSESYNAAAASSANVLIFQTWNDFEEETDIVPSIRKGDALASIVGCYNRLFKTGTLDCGGRLAVSFPNALPNEQTTPSPRFWGGRPSWSENGFQPKAYYWLSGLAAGLSLKCNGVQLAAGRGIHIGEIPLSERSEVTCTVGGRQLVIPALRAVDREEDVPLNAGLRYRTLSFEF